MDVSKESIVSIIRVIKIGELEIMLAVAINRRKLRRKLHLYLYFYAILLLLSVHELLVTANVVPTSPILINLMTEAKCSSETSVLARATRRNIPDAIL
jgi:hypothetical protein